VVTREPNSLLEGLPHHRMPAILLGDTLHRWLDPNDLSPDPPSSRQILMNSKAESSPPNDSGSC